MGLSSASEKTLEEIESHLCSESGKKLGRDELPKFKHWKSGSESAACRFVRTACDVLGPRGDAKNGCRQYWDAFCREKLQKRSRVSSFRMNRFNGPVQIHSRNATEIQTLGQYASLLLSKDDQGIFEEFGVPKDDIFAKLFDNVDLQCKSVLENMIGMHFAERNCRKGQECLHSE